MQQHLHTEDFILASGFDFGSNGKKNKVGTCNTVQCRGKSERDRRAEHRRLRQTPQHVDESHYGTDDPHGWGIAAGGFEYFSIAVVAVLRGINLKLHDLFDQVLIRSVNDKLYTFLKERILVLGSLSFQGKNPGAAGRDSHGYDILDNLFMVLSSGLECKGKAIRNRLQLGSGEADQYGCKCSSEDN
ncbi:hypothetical protein D3C72_1112630 [compost metagenome]